MSDLEVKLAKTAHHIQILDSAFVGVFLFFMALFAALSVTAF